MPEGPPPPPAYVASGQARADTDAARNVTRTVTPDTLHITRPMAANCASCDHPQSREINHRIRDGRPLTDISRWLAELGTPITRQALARHARAHLSVTPIKGRRGASPDFLSAVRDRAAERLESGDLEPNLKDGMRAQALLDARANRNADRDLLARIALALTANVRVLDPEVEALEAEYRPLLTAGDQ